MDILSKFHKQVGPNKRIGGSKAQINKWGGKFANRVGWKKCKKGGEKYKNANRVDSFIWHLRVGQYSHTNSVVFEDTKCSLEIN